MNAFTRFAGALAVTACAFLCGGANAAVSLTGTFQDGSAPDDFFRLTFTCYGSPTCAGPFSVAEHDIGCTNGFSFSGTMTITGVDVSHPGTFGGTVTLSVDSSSPSNVNGVCSYTLHPGPVGTYTATWDGTKGTIAEVGGAGAGNFTASGVAPTPTFPMTVTANVTQTSATASAQVQPRTQDAGTTQSIFVFAYAPLSQVHGSKRAPEGSPIRVRLRDGDPCVLAQVENGQLVGVSASTMTAATTGVLNSQGQSVSILNNVSTPSVAGATMYVGYGANASTMLANGVYQGAVNIPGGSQCVVNLSSAAAPTSPGALTGLWWNASESGWGIHFTQRGNNVFAAWYTYDTAGKAKWYVSTCSGFTGQSGTCNGTLYQVTGPSFFGGAFNPSLVNATNAGTLQITFSNANAASMTYTAVAGQTRTVSLTRQPLASGSVPPAVDFSDIWWGGTSESGWGMAMAQQYGTTFLAWYVYDATGKPTWLVATCTMSGTSCAGTLYRTSGPPFGPAFNPNAVQAVPAGSITVNFTDANNALLTYTVDGVEGTKAVTRQLF
jgi:hypothetical protein